MTDRTMVLGLVLAGGEGRRMGGRDKGLLPLGNRPMVAHVLERLMPQVACACISANRHPAAYAELGVPVWGDAPAWQGMGPLAALASLQARHAPASPGAALCRGAWVQLAPCDTPEFPSTLVARLAAAWEKDPSLEVAYPCTEAGPQPAMLLATWAALASVAEYLEEGGRSLRGWIARRHSIAVDCEDLAAGFVNANTPEALLRLEQKWKESHA